MKCRIVLLRDGLCMQVRDEYVALHYDLLVGRQKRDSTPQLAITVTFRNNSDAPIKTPFAVKVSNGDSACLNIQLEDAANDGTGDSAVWALSDAFPGGVLASGATG